MEETIFPNPCTYVKETTSKIIPIMEHVKIDQETLQKFVSNLLQDKNALKSLVLGFEYANRLPSLHLNS